MPELVICNGLIDRVVGDHFTTLPILEAAQNTLVSAHRVHAKVGRSQSCGIGSDQSATHYFHTICDLPELIQSTVGSIEERNNPLALQNQTLDCWQADERSHSVRKGVHVTADIQDMLAVRLLHKKCTSFLHVSSVICDDAQYFLQANDVFGVMI